MTHLDIRRLASLVDGWSHPVAVIGGLAVILRVQPRATRDIDIVIVAPEPRDALLPALGAAGYEYESEGIDEWLDGGLVRAHVPGTGEGLDLIIADVPYLVGVATRARPVVVDDQTLPVATLEDLLLLKLEAGRPQDLDDALAIRDAFAATLDRALLSTLGPMVGVDAIAFLDGA